MLLIKKTKTINNLILFEEKNQKVTISLSKYSLKNLDPEKTKVLESNLILMILLNLFLLNFFYKNHKKLEIQQHNIKDLLIKIDIKYCILLMQL